MSNYHCDYHQVRTDGFTVEDTDGTLVNADCYIIPVLIPLSEVQELLQNYDPASGTSPSVSYSRPLSRAILDAIRRYEGVQ